MLKRLVRASSGCMSGLVLKFHAAEDGYAADIQGFARSPAGGLRGADIALGAVYVAPENSLAVGDNFPIFRDPQFAPAKNRVDRYLSVIVGNDRLAQIDFDAPENRGGRAAFEVLAGDAAFHAAEECEFVQVAARIAG